jgi:hypothetical protein
MKIYFYFNNGALLPSKAFVFKSENKYILEKESQYYL